MDDVIHNENNAIKLQKIECNKNDKRIDTNHHFEPSMKILARILKMILEKNSLGRTTLSQEANINYSTLSKHLDWLKNKSVVYYVIEGGKVNIRLTSNGKEFASQLQKLSL